MKEMPVHVAGDPQQRAPGASQSRLACIVGSKDRQMSGDGPPESSLVFQFRIAIDRIDEHTRQRFIQQLGCQIAQCSTVNSRRDMSAIEREFVFCRLPPSQRDGIQAT
jgi:hypothetical protein